MQKLQTVAINIEKLKASSKGAFTMTDVEGINTLLHEGWMIQEWEFITAEGEDEKAVVLLILNDEIGDHEFDVTAYSNSVDAAEDDDDDEAFEDDDDQIDETTDDDEEGDEVENGPAKNASVR